MNSLDTLVNSPMFQQEILVLVQEKSDLCGVNTRNLPMNSLVYSLVKDYNGAVLSLDQKLLVMVASTSLIIC